MGDERAGAEDVGLRAELVRLLAEERTGGRRRERSLRQQAEVSATFAGVLVDLAEAGSPVVLTGAGGRRHRVEVRAVAQDCCAVRTAAGVDLLLRTAALTMVRPADGGPAAATGDRPVALDTSLGECLALLVADRPRVHVIAGDGERTDGELRSVGIDVVTVRLDGSGPNVAYLPLASIAEVGFSG